ncbi:MAG: L-2-amino-thiazoline-4-carboxylic acid hydrolase [Candidatus Methanoperedens sp.]|nr:L-2-amino-thiazoline-4-carboxylic acid hydrolase [Candidatus Methanoperedens sp.]MCZ7370318.1 L-2-amino-thiazoline-4-carboxylic acid hydrolase [Candidatus Methanoperedens sp.]
MASIEDIPLEKRWEIAAKSASAMPLMYDMHFRKVLGEKYDEIEQPLWIELGKELKNFATAMGLPSRNAKEVSDIFRIAGMTLYGPEFRFEMLEESKERVVGRVVECPMLNRAREMGLDPETVALRACVTFNRSAVENLNPKYTHKLNANMCSGDRSCEMVIERQNNV